MTTLCASATRGRETSSAMTVRTRVCGAALFTRRVYRATYYDTHTSEALLGVTAL